MGLLSDGAVRELPEDRVLASVRKGMGGACSFFPLTLQSKKLSLSFGAMFGNQQEKFQVDLERDGARGDLGGEARNRLINQGNPCG